MNHHLTENGEFIEFTDIIDITNKLCKSCGLSGVGKNRVIYMSLTLYGSQLTNKFSFVMAGLKLVDLALRNPSTVECVTLVKYVCCLEMEFHVNE